MSSLRKTRRDFLWSSEHGWRCRMLLVCRSLEDVGRNLRNREDPEFVVGEETLYQNSSIDATVCGFEEGVEVLDT